MNLPTRLLRQRLAACLFGAGAALLVAPAVAAAAPAVEAPASPAGAAEARRILLVRHAEAASGDSDPELTPAGRRRAEALADLLADEPLAAVLATDTRRARATAAPVAARHGLEIELYDHRRLADLAARLRGREGAVLVVGHSNTTPELVHLLGGDPGPPIAHDEHDRLYRVDPASGESSVERAPAPGPGPSTP